MVKIGLSKARINFMLLILIAAFGFYFRYISHSDTLAGADPYFHYRMVNYILTHGTLPGIDHLSYYPDGREISGAIQPLLPYTVAFSYKILNLFLDITLTEYMIILPALLGALTCVVLYFFTRELFDESIGLSAAFIYAVLPAAISRSWAGFLDKEALAQLLILAWMLYFFKAIGERDTKNGLSFAILSGILLGLSGLTWGGASYFLLVVAFSLLIYILVGRATQELLLSYSMLVIIGTGIMFLFMPLRVSINRFRLPFLVLILTIIELVLLRYELSKKNQAVIKSIALLAIVILALIFLEGFGIEIKSWFTTSESNIEEYRSTKLFGIGTDIAGKIWSGDWWTFFHGLAIIVPLGLISLFKDFFYNKKFRDIFLIVWAVSGVMATMHRIRLAFLLAPVAAIIGSEVLFKVYQFSKSNHKENSVRPVVSGIIIGLAGFSLIYGGYNFANNLQRGMPYPYWYEALEWAGDNLPEDSIIVARWDKGYWIQAIAGRYTLADNSNAGINNVNADIARFFCSKEEEAIKIFNFTNPTYVAVGTDDFVKTRSLGLEGNCFIPVSSFKVYKKDANTSTEALHFLERNVEDLPESRDIFFIREEADSYYIYYLDYTGNAELKDSMFARLLPFSETGEGKGLDHFRLAYNNSGTYIYEMR